MLLLLGESDHSLSAKLHFSQVSPPLRSGQPVNYSGNKRGKSPHDGS
jgi:hypothetical protein